MNEIFIANPQLFQPLDDMSQVVGMLQQQIRKTCFDKCFSSGSYPEQLAKSDQICLAKCMDRMIEAHQIVVRA